MCTAEVCTLQSRDVLNSRCCCELSYSVPFSHHKLIQECLKAARIKLGDAVMWRIKFDHSVGFLALQMENLSQQRRRLSGLVSQVHPVLCPPFPIKHPLLSHPALKTHHNLSVSHLTAL